MRGLYPLSPTFEKGHLKVSDIHDIYYEISGNPKGIPVVHLHGGPGGQSFPKYGRFYNPEKYMIILFDQRGCGKSTPLGEIRENTTQDLVSDMEKLRSHLKVGKWVVSGGSWGSTLALAYSEKYPENVLFLIVRAVITYQKSELDWAVEGGASNFFPEAWDRYIGIIPENERDNLTKAYAKRVFGDDLSEQKRAAFESDNWGLSIANLDPKTPDLNRDFGEPEIASSKVFYHYELNNGFFEENELITNANKLIGIPGVIIQGRYDVICPPITAWKLHKKWTGSVIEIVVGGHHYSNINLRNKLLEWTDKIAERLSE